MINDMTDSEFRQRVIPCVLELDELVGGLCSDLIAMAFGSFLCGVHDGLVELSGGDSGDLKHLERLSATIFEQHPPIGFQGIYIGQAAWPDIFDDAAFAVEFRRLARPDCWLFVTHPVGGHDPLGVVFHPGQCPDNLLGHPALRGKTGIFFAPGDHDLSPIFRA